MAFHENAVFPDGIAINSTFGWGFSTAVLTNTAGAEYRVARREVVQHTGDISTGIKDPEDLFVLKKFHMARRGALHGFRFKDPLDFTSNFSDPYPGGPTVTSDTDQECPVIAGTSNLQYQLQKVYDDPDLNYVRKITKPIAGTVSVAVNGVSQGSGWSVDTSTGIITFSSAPVGTVTAGFQFHTPVRFEVDADRALEIAFKEWKYGDIPRIGIIELLDEGFANEDAWYGGAYYYEGTSNISISPLTGRYIAINTGAQIDVVLPSLSNLAPGGPYFYIHNQHPSVSSRIVDNAGTLLTLIANAELWTVMIGVDSNGNPEWQLALSS